MRSIFELDLPLCSQSVSAPHCWSDSPHHTPPATNSESLSTFTGQMNQGLKSSEAAKTNKGMMENAQEIMRCDSCRSIMMQILEKEEEMSEEKARRKARMKSIKEKALEIIKQREKDESDEK